MKYVRVAFNEEEYIKIKKYADTANKIPSKYLKAIALRKNKDIHLYFLFHTINILLEKTLTEVKSNTYNESDSPILTYLFTIENHLNEILHDNNCK